MGSQTVPPANAATDAQRGYYRKLSHGLELPPNASKREASSLISLLKDHADDSGWSIDVLKRGFPAQAGQVVLLVTEITHMKDGYFCVAARDLHGDRVVRPLQPTGKNWKIESNPQHRCIRPGAVLLGRSSGKPGSGCHPHVHDDLLLDEAPASPLQLPAEVAYRLLVPLVDPSVSAIFGGYLIDNKYLVEGTQCRSLGAVRVPVAAFRFLVDAEGRLRATFSDQEGGVYDVKVTNAALRDAFPVTDGIPTAADGANEWLASLDQEEALVLRVGLARGWDNERRFPQKRCYLQLNAIICSRRVPSSPTRSAEPYE
jgi:hypothetical protein